MEGELISDPWNAVRVVIDHDVMPVVCVVCVVGFLLMLSCPTKNSTFGIVFFCWSNTVRVFQSGIHFSRPVLCRGFFHYFLEKHKALCPSDEGSI